MLWFAALREADTGIDHQALARNAVVLRAGDGARQIGEDVTDDVAVFGVRIHVLGPPARVHQDRRHAARRDQGAQVRVVLERADVVDDRRAAIERRGGHHGLVGVDRNRDADRGANRLHRRLDPRQLLRRADRPRPGPRRLGADVDDVGACRFHLQRDVARARRVERPAAV